MSDTSSVVEAIELIGEEILTMLRYMLLILAGSIPIIEYNLVPSTYR